MKYKRLYIKNGLIFLTVVTSKRRPILTDNIDVLRDSFKNAQKYHNFDIQAAVILPDHFHILIKPKNIEKYSQIISLIKTTFSRKVDITQLEGYELSKSRADKNEKDIWQRRFWEHTIRDEEDLYNHIDYIHYNPVKHGLVKNVKDWKYSTFHRFVQSEQYDINWVVMKISEISIR